MSKEQQPISMQSLQDEIDGLESKVEELESEISDLETDLKKVKKLIPDDLEKTLTSFLKRIEELEDRL